MNNHHNPKNTIIDIISQYPISVNKLLYANKVDTYDSIDLQDYEITFIADSIFDLLSDDIYYIKSNDIDISKQFIDFYSKNREFQFLRYDEIGLTKQGGEYWEFKFLPNWYHYIQVYYTDNGYHDFSELLLQSLNKDMIDDIIIKFNLSGQDYHISQESNWQPCYWKDIKDTSFILSITSNDIKQKIIIDDIYRYISNLNNEFCSLTKNFI